MRSRSRFLWELKGSLGSVEASDVKSSDMEGSPNGERMKWRRDGKAQGR